MVKGREERHDVRLEGTSTRFEVQFGDTGSISPIPLAMTGHHTRCHISANQCLHTRVKEESCTKNRTLQCRYQTSGHHTQRRVATMIVYVGESNKIYAREIDISYTATNLMPPHPMSCHQESISMLEIAQREQSVAIKSQVFSFLVGLFFCFSATSIIPFTGLGISACFLGLFADFTRPFLM